MRVGEEKIIRDSDHKQLVDVGFVKLFVHAEAATELQTRELDRQSRFSARIRTKYGYIT